jgi:integrase/recombinase XerD
MKNNRYGQSSIISVSEYLSIRSGFKSKKYKLLLDLAWYTGERWGAIVQLKFDDIFLASGKTREFITFRAITRKARPDGKRETRQVPIHANLRDSLQDYKLESPSECPWLFPNQGCKSHINLRLADKLLRAALVRAGLESKGISTHSTRRSFITHLHGKGVDIYTIQKITGHKDLKALGRYVEISSDRIKGAINLL